MKKLFIFAAAMLLTSSTIKAEQYDELPKNEMSVSYGYAPFYWILDQVGQAFGIVFTAPLRALMGENAEYIDIQAKKCFGVVNFDYRYHVSPKIGLGINFSWSKAQGDYVAVNTTRFKDSRVGQKLENYYTIMPTLKLEWFRREHVSMYSRFSIGVLMASKIDENFENFDSEKNQSVEASKETEFSVYPMFQASPFGVEAGNEHIRGFAEVGFGQAGLIQVGVRTRF